jgi:hypothetical protein
MGNWIVPMAIIVIIIGFTVNIVTQIKTLGILQLRLKQTWGFQIITPVVYLLMTFLYIMIDRWIALGFGYLGMLYFFRAFYPDGIYKGGIKHSNRVVFWKDVTGYQIDSGDSKHKTLKFETLPSGIFKRTLASFNIQPDVEKETRNVLLELNIVKTSNRKL